MYAYLKQSDQPSDENFDKQIPKPTKTQRDCSTCPYAANSVDNQSVGCYGPYYEGCMLDQHKDYE